jgi:hypothetical protein
METKFFENNIVEIVDDTLLIKEADDILTLFFANNFSTIIIRKENIIDDFYNLSTGIAGEILQKVSNYRKWMAIIGDFENIKSKSLRDFIHESNKTRQILFVKTVEEALRIFNR